MEDELRFVALDRHALARPLVGGELKGENAAGDRRAERVDDVGQHDRALRRRDLVQGLERQDRQRVVVRVVVAERRHDDGAG